MAKMKPTTLDYEKAFTEWDRRYREEPARFDSDFKRIMRGQTIVEYGQSAAAYFEEMLTATARH